MQTTQLTGQRQSKMSDFNEEMSHFKLEWSQLLYPSDDMNDEDLNEILMQIDMPEAHENLVLDSEHSIVSANVFISNRSPSACYNSKFI